MALCWQLYVSILLAHWRSCSVFHQLPAQGSSQGQPSFLASLSNSIWMNLVSCLSLGRQSKDALPDVQDSIHWGSCKTSDAMTEIQHSQASDKFNSSIGLVWSASKCFWCLGRGHEGCLPPFVWGSTRSALSVGHYAVASSAEAEGSPCASLGAPRGQLCDHIPQCLSCRLQHRCIPSSSLLHSLRGLFFSNHQAFTNTVDYGQFGTAHTNSDLMQRNRRTLCPFKSCISYTQRKRGTGCLSASVFVSLLAWPFYSGEDI